jgi:Domain of unknown function (DUF4124)
MNGRIWIATIALATALWDAPALQAAKLYKWVDEQGNVTYSQTKPADREAETIRLRSATLDSSGAEERLDKLNERAETQRKDREIVEDSAAAAAKRDERMANNCGIARENMRILKTTSRIRANDTDGEAYFLDEAGIQAKIALTQQQIDENCN